MMLLKFHYERGCKTFFKKHKNEQKIIKQLIDQAITKELATGMTKVKIAAMTRIEEKSNLQKDSFSHELETVLKGSHYAFNSN